MLKFRLLFLCGFIVFILTSNVFAIGGIGAICNPNESEWGTCTLSRPSWDSSVTNSATIAGGSYSSPFVANQANTEYTLQGDITADGTAIVITKDYVIINLNGYTITYNETTAGEGVVVGEYNINNVAVLNGSIIQGAAQSEGDEYGSFINPISTCYTANANCRGITYGFVANIYVKYGGRDISGIKLTGGYITVTESTIEDTEEYGTLENRMQGVDAINFTYGSCEATDNTIINARQRGITVGNNALVTGNKISIRSIATNSYGVFGYAVTGCDVHSNTITARGEHPLGIGFVSDGTDNIEIYDNYIDCQVTRLGTEYGAVPPFDADTIYDAGMSATGFRTTWGGDNINFHDNEIHVTASSDYAGTYSPDGTAVRIKTDAKGLFTGILSGETALFKDNVIYALDNDGTTETYGIDCASNHSDGIFYINNIVTSDVAPMVIGESYGACDGYVLIKGNTFIKSGDYVSFVTYSNQLDGYYNSKARIVDNSYQDGAAVDDIDFKADNDGTIDIYFGSDSGSTDYFNYRWYDKSNTSNILLREDYDPAVVFPSYVPVDDSSTDLEAPSNLRNMAQ